MSEFDILQTSEKEAFLNAYTGTSPVVTVPEVVAIGDDAFSRNKFIEEVIIPEGVDYIGNYAFSECSNLKKIVLPKSLQEINLGAFSGCTNLREISFPIKLRIIAPKAFLNCDSLFSNPLKLPDFLIEVAKDSFGEKTLDLLFSNPVYEQKDGLVFNTNAKSLLFSVDLEKETVKIENGTKYLAWNSLSNMRNLKKVSVPNSVTYIGRGSFMFDSSLEEIILPSSVQSIDSGAFENCTKLKKVIVQGEGLMYIAPNAFSGCGELKTITVPSECEIDELAFDRHCDVKHRNI